jgi:hypothetical protein
MATAGALACLGLGYDTGQVDADGGEPVALPAGQSATPKAEPTLAAFEPLLSQDLRRPLFDPAVARLQPRALPVKLTGLIAEPGRSLAVLQTLDGQTQLKAPGERCGEVDVLSISGQAVEVRFEGQTHRLTVPKKENGG